MKPATRPKGQLVISYSGRTQQVNNLADYDAFYKISSIEPCSARCTTVHRSATAAMHALQCLPCGALLGL
jgi:hypothetical protein